MKDIVGSWTLQRYSKASATGNVVLPYGRDATGLLIYTSDGCMSATLMSAGRQPLNLALERWAALGPLNFKRLHGAALYFKAATQFTSYCGRYTVQGNQVLHDVTLALYPDWVGSRLTRTADFEEDGSLTLAFTDSVGSRHCLNWARGSLDKP